jgi:hypothetical protein
VLQLGVAPVGRALGVERRQLRVRWRPLAARDLAVDKRGLEGPHVCVEAQQLASIPRGRGVCGRVRVCAEGQAEAVWSRHHSLALEVVHLLRGCQQQLLLLLLGLLHRSADGGLNRRAWRG